jgi:ethanolamine ammonia-lyase small subunit
VTALPDPWMQLRRLTPARIALGRSGASLPTREVLAFSLAHARARDAVHRALDVAGLCRALDAVHVASAAPDRATYLRRPDLGRVLAPGAEAALFGIAGEVAIVVADGLSAAAAETQAPAVLAHALPALCCAGFAMARTIVATQARVALGDAVAAGVGAQAVAVLIGERPGLSVPASLGIYLTWHPVPGRSTDADRNCISNIQADGLSAEAAAAKLVWLLSAARTSGFSGVRLKDESEAGRSLVGGSDRSLRQT